LGQPYHGNTQVLPMDRFLPAHVRLRLDTGRTAWFLLHMKVIISYGLCASLFLSVPLAGATPRALPFSYPNETLPEGAVEVEVITDANPMRVAADPNDATAGSLWEPELRLQTELEYGITDRFEFGFYQVFKATPVAGGESPLGFDGLKWRLRTRLAEPGQWPIDVGFYFELETMHDELALEGKVNLQRRLGRFTLLSNLWVEEEFERPYDSAAHGRKAHFVVNPTLGMSVQVTPRFHPGIECWARGQLVATGESPQERENSRVQYFVGPTTYVNWGRLFWTVGLYLHVNDTSSPQPGDTYGPFWLRTLVGVEL
jgi:hypothetical protein